MTHGYAIQARCFHVKYTHRYILYTHTTMRYRCEILNHGIDGYEVWLHGRNKGRSGVKMFKLHKNVKKFFLTDLEIVTPDPINKISDLYHRTGEPFLKSDLRVNPEQKNTLLYVRNLERQKRFKSSSTNKIIFDINEKS